MPDDDPIFSESQWERLEARLALPPRQLQVIRQLFKGRGDKQIAGELGLALPTVRSHLRRVYIKFDVNDRTELILHLVREFIRMDGTAHGEGIGPDAAPTGPVRREDRDPAGLTHLIADVLRDITANYLRLAELYRSCDREDLAIEAENKAHDHTPITRDRDSELAMESA